MNIDPGETEIIGSWVMVNGQMTGDDACRRIRLLTATSLKLIASAQSGWERLYQDSQDERYWELTHPHGDLQGGGPQALLLISSEKAKEKYGISII